MRKKRGRRYTSLGREGLKLFGHLCQFRVKKKKKERQMRKGRNYLWAREKDNCKLEERSFLVSRRCPLIFKKEARKSVHYKKKKPSGPNGKKERERRAS